MRVPHLTVIADGSSPFTFTRRQGVAKKLYVGNLPFSSTEEQVKELFAQCGEILSVKIITDRATGRSRGFCFVEMENADQAMSELNGKEFGGRKLMINEAREREQRPPR
jgi:RNA recognition motif-containing protein